MKSADPYVYLTGVVDTEIGFCQNFIDVLIWVG